MVVFILFLGVGFAVAVGLRWGQGGLHVIFGPYYSSLQDWQSKAKSNIQHSVLVKWNNMKSQQIKEHYNNQSNSKYSNNDRVNITSIQ